ncbi:MAG TPA: 1,4-alpha-glucan branching enzyme [Firmicutes bacterium]|nr:1,4-alpha-glucan branching enzyme [Bacillota bacterium]
MLKFTSDDLYLFAQGTHQQLYKKLGAQLVKENNEIIGTHFAVFAPNAICVKVVGDFNGWNGENHIMENDNGIWSLYIEDIKPLQTYKYEILTKHGHSLLKADPYAYYAEQRPATASRVFDLEGFTWEDQVWRETKTNSNIFEQPLNIYEMHLGSWKRPVQNITNETFLSYQDLTDDIITYVKEHSYTHIEIMPLCEHPFDGSWGYQATGYYAATSRYGDPKDLMAFINECHKAGIGVIMDWIPGHFCKDAHGLFKFDGEPLYEYPFADVSENSGWGTANFDLARGEVRSFLISNALYWMEYFHIDGFRVDAVANIIYWLGDSSRGVNQGGIEFLQKLNQAIFKQDDKMLMIAEDSTSYPLVTAPVDQGGIGFSYKWNMGWMNDTLDYMEESEVWRKDYHSKITFSMAYAYSENFILPFSHDEVVHGKKALVDKAPGDYWQKLAQYRLLMTYQMTLPGKKLNFMGNEIAQFHEWKDKEQVDWHLKLYPSHDAANRYVKDLNAFYLTEPALWELDHSFEGFEWIDVNNTDQSIFSYIRKAKNSDDHVIVILNFRPFVYHRYSIGVPSYGEYVEVLNSDLDIYNGSNQFNGLSTLSEEGNVHGKPYHINITIPPYGAVILKYKPVLTELVKDKKEVASKSKTKVKAKPKAQLEVDVLAELEVEAKSEVKVKPKTQRKPRAKAAIETEVKAEVESEVKAKPKTQRKPRAKATVATEVKAEAESEVKAKPKTQRKPRAKAAVEAEIKAEAESEVKAKPKMQRKSRAKAAVEAEIKAEVESEVKTKPKRQRKPKVTSETVETVKVDRIEENE